jgi:hypothetical protein
MREREKKGEGESNELDDESYTTKMAFAELNTFEIFSH